ncbi:MAG: SMP-30/gluconolactonase/LRE family protein [Alphaproteobacteria bacterium]|nr:SMP-30/gluconolactonase/LRE family protein [Alphaproteobacteria bacterium]
MQLLGSIRVGNALGEGALWDAEAQALWWTDIEERKLFRYDWRGRSLGQYALPERLGSFGFVRNSEELVAAFETGFAFFSPARNTASWLKRIDGLGHGMRFNDGRVDCRGRFWAGTMAETEADTGNAELYCLTGDGSVHRRERGLTVSNGLCWSPDGRVMYLADSPRHAIWCYDFEAETGCISNRRTFAATPADAFPDGATVDSEGFLWSAQWGAGRVVRYAPNGGIERIVEVPASQPTCVAFGGPDMDLLFVTSARDGLGEEALRSQDGAGDVFVYRSDVKGLPEPQFHAARV